MRSSLRTLCLKLCPHKSIVAGLLGLMAVLATAVVSPGPSVLGAQYSASQTGPPSNPAQPGAARPDAGGEGDDLDPAMREKMRKSQNDLRQKQLVADTKKLLALAQELQTEVDKSNKDMLSLAVVKKAEEIEKLARSVRDKMKAQ